VATGAAPAAAPAPAPAVGPAVNFAAAPVQASFSRPVALTSATGTGTGAYVAPASKGLHFPHPIAAIRRRIASSLAMRQSVSVAPLGYFTVAVFTLVILMYLVTIMAIMPAASNLLQHANPQTAWAQLSAGQQHTLQVVSIAFAVVGVVALVAFSVFVGLSTHNATGLGAGQPMLTPYRAGTCWAGLLRAQALIGVGLILPAALIWENYTIPGLIAALIVVELAHRRLDDPGGWLTRPARHLPDLYARLGVEGSTSSPLATIWSVSFNLANLAAIGVSALPLLALIVLVALVASGRNEVMWQSVGLAPTQVAVAVFTACLTVLTVASVALLIPLTVGLARRQQTRRTLVRVGRSRSWVARPGEGGYAPAPAATARFDESVDEDRIVERRPTLPPRQQVDPGPGNSGRAQGFGGPAQGGPEEAAPSFSRPPMGSPDFGNPGISRGPGFGFGGLGFSRPPLSDPGAGGPVAGEPDQASLYSPSTTSSLPASDDSSDAPG